MKINIKLTAASDNNPLNLAGVTHSVDDTLAGYINLTLVMLWTLPLIGPHGEQFHQLSGYAPHDDDNGGRPLTWISLEIGRITEILGQILCKIVENWANLWLNVWIMAVTEDYYKQGQKWVKLCDLNVKCLLLSTCPDLFYYSYALCLVTNLSMPVIMDNKLKLHLTSCIWISKHILSWLYRAAISADFQQIKIWQLILLTVLAEG